MIIRIIILLMGSAIFSAQAMDKAESFKRIQTQLQNSTTPDISIIIELQDTADDPALRRSAYIKTDLMKSLFRVGAREHKRYKHLSMMAVQVNAQGLQELEKSPHVKKIYQNKLRKHSLASSTVQVQADKAWARNQLGSDVTVAVVDAGFSNFTDMFDAPGKVVKEACFTTTINIQGIQLNGNCWPNNSQMRIGPDAAAQNCNPCAAGNDHGSLVAGVAVGNADQYSPKLRGVARESSIIAVNVFSRVVDQRFCGFDPDYGPSCVVALDSDILAGLDYVYAQRFQHTIAAVNLSFGSGAYQSACDNTSVYTSVINKFKNSNIAVIAAAGNEGSSTSISEPACLSNIVAVGSVGNTNDVSVFSNSNRLIDFWAPGERITTDSGNCLNCYKTVNGTSFSAPHVAGAFAILKSLNKALTVDEIKTALSTSGLAISDPLNSIRRPLIQINNAIDIVPRPPNVAPILQLLLLNEASFRQPVNPPISPVNCVNDFGTILNQHSVLTVNGSLSNDCDSVSRTGSFARFYSFRLSQNTTIVIEQNGNSIDSYLSLLSGKGKDGAVITSNDDGGSGLNSRIEISLLENTDYTIEASSLSGGEIGTFQIVVSR